MADIGGPLPWWNGFNMMTEDNELYSISSRGRPTAASVATLVNLGGLSGAGCSGESLLSSCGLTQRTKWFLHRKQLLSLSSASARMFYIPPNILGSSKQHWSYFDMRGVFCSWQITQKTHFIPRVIDRIMLQLKTDQFSPKLTNHLAHKCSKDANANTTDGASPFWATAAVGTQVAFVQKCLWNDFDQFGWMVNSEKPARWSGCFSGSLLRNATQSSFGLIHFSSTLAAASVPSVLLQFAALTHPWKDIVNIRITLCSLIVLDILKQQFILLKAAHRPTCRLQDVHTNVHQHIPTRSIERTALSLEYCVGMKRKTETVFQGDDTSADCVFGTKIQRAKMEKDHW